jgi:hypothetical protein
VKTDKGVRLMQGETETAGSGGSDILKSNE